VVRQQRFSSVICIRTRQSIPVRVPDHLKIQRESYRTTVETITAGYRGLRNGSAWLDLSGRGKIHVTGEDRARLLHAMTTNQVQKLHPNEGCYAFFLNAQGRILADANILNLGDYFLLDTEPETVQKVYEHLDRYIIADDVTLSEQTNGTFTLSIEGPDAEIALERLDICTPAEPYTSGRQGDMTVARIDTTGAGGYMLFGPVDEKWNLVDKLTANQVPQATAEEARVVRIERGRPRYGEEITERYLVQETNQMHAVNFNKGCYLGQEIVERVRSRAQIHRVLRRLKIESAVPPEAGLKLKAGDADAGEIASSAFSPALEKCVALAYMRTQYAESGTEVMCGPAVARVS
jgi:tRNA-modifying protein YgfZ